MDTLFVGLDVHKLSISVTTAEDGRDGAVRFCGEVANTPEQVRKLSDRLSRPGNRLEFCYEAGGCGYGIYRQLTEMGHGCLVAAPTLINYFVDILKSTSLAFTLGVTEMMGAAQKEAAGSFRYLESFLVVAIIYWIMVEALSRVQAWLERRTERRATGGTRA